MEQYADEAAGLLLLRATIEELSSQVQHLEHSQSELQDALNDTPDDEDFLLALRENEEGIRMKKDRIDGLQEQLYQLDVAFRQEKASEQRGFVIVSQLQQSSSQSQLLIQPPAQSSSAVNITVPPTEHQTVVEEAVPPATGAGLYL